MPSTYAHYTFGERMLPLFPAKIRALIQENRALYDIGLHGPDILFYYKALCSNEVNAVGYEMHDKPGADFFAPAKEIWQQFRTDGASCAQHTAYLLGFLFCSKQAKTLYAHTLHSISILPGIVRVLLLIFSLR